MPPDTLMVDFGHARACTWTIDHKDALSYYLKHYKKIDAKPKYCEISVLEQNWMIIRYGRGEAKIEFNPSVVDKKEMRKRLNVMLHEAYEGLGLSEYQVTTYRLSLLQGISFFFGAYFFTTFLTTASVTPLESFIRGCIPAGREALAALAIPLLHLFEYPFYLRPLLIKHRVPFNTSTKWFIASILFGYPTVPTFLGLVKEAEWWGKNEII